MNGKSVAFALRFCVALCSLSIACHSYSLEEKVDGKWRLSQFKVQPDWTEKDRRVPFILASVSQNLPISHRLKNLPPVGNQGSQASGTAWALGYFAATYVYKQNKKEKKGYLCSPAFVYNSLNRGVDKGIELVDGLELLKKHGCPNEKYMPYNAADPAYKPSSRARRDAGNYRIHNFGRVDYTDLDQVRSYLLQNRPIIITLMISENFIKLEEAVWQQPEGQFRGIHSLALVGYDDEKRIFYLLNSVGSAWGKDGLSAIPYSWFIRLTKQAYTLW